MTSRADPVDAIAVEEEWRTRRERLAAQERAREMELTPVEEERSLLGDAVPDKNRAPQVRTAMMLKGSGAASLTPAEASRLAGMRLQGRGGLVRGMVETEKESETKRRREAGAY